MKNKTISWVALLGLVFSGAVMAQGPFRDTLSEDQKLARAFYRRAVTALQKGREDEKKTTDELKAAEGALAEYNKQLEEAKKLPDSDATKAAQVAGVQKLIEKQTKTVTEKKTALDDINAWQTKLRAITNHSPNTTLTESAEYGPKLAEARKWRNELQTNLSNRVVDLKKLKTEIDSGKLEKDALEKKTAEFRKLQELQRQEGVLITLLSQLLGESPFMPEKVDGPAGAAGDMREKKDEKAAPGTGSGGGAAGGGAGAGRSGAPGAPGAGSGDGPGIRGVRPADPGIGTSRDGGEASAPTRAGGGT